MKLNKVLALALSGVMAVSMLAGCSTDGKDEGNTEVTPPTSNAVSVMNDAQSIVKFEADTDFDAALAAAAKKAKYTNVSGAEYKADLATTSDAVYTELNKKLPVGEALSTSAIAFTGGSANKVTTKTVLYCVESNGLTEKAALEMIAADMKNSDYPEIVSASSKNYKASYTGNVSVVTVSATDGGKTETAYYIAVSVTQTIAKDATV